MSDIKVTRKKLADYTLDPENPNKGSTRGAAMLEGSVSEFGPARSGVADSNGVIRAGNHTAEQLFEAGIEDVIEIETDGKAWVVVKRTDMTEQAGKAYAVADNRAGEFIEWDGEVLARLSADGTVDLEEFFYPQEIAGIQAAQDEEGWAGALDGLPTGDKPPFVQMTFTLSNAQAAVVSEALKKAKDAGAFIDTGNKNSNGNALWRACDAYLHS